MSKFSFLLFLPLSLAAPAHAQTSPSEPTAPTGTNSEKIEHLDKFVVSSGPDPKTSFDLAQGTSVLAGDELRRLAHATLGETLAGTPGVSASSFGPGASRPVIRGLGGDRIRVLDNGVGALDASNVSPDHNTALEPLFASSIEVLRGPSTLLYGSSAVGGAVNVIDNTIPQTAPDGRAAGTLEFRAGGATRERAGVLSVGGGEQAFAVHVNALKQQTSDVRIPGVARIDAAAPPAQPVGTLPSSATDTFSVGVGASVFGSAGHAGAGLTHYETEYGVPTGDTPPTSIRMRQTRLDLAGEITRPFGIFRGARLRAGLGDYRHAELGGGTETHTTFTNRAAEGRIELPHVTAGALSGTVGLQGARSDFAAVGEEVATPPSLTTSGAIFAVEEIKLHEHATLQFGARAETQAIRLGDVDAGLPLLPGYAAHAGQRKSFQGLSGSLGLVLHPAKDWSVGASLAYTERLPTAQELFSNGPHGGTGAYEVGSSGLGNERSVGFDLNVRRRAGFVTGSIGAFVNRFSDYIFEDELPANAIPAARNPDGLTPFRFVARDARFYGGEAELEFHLLERDARQLHLTVTSDFVHAEETTSGRPLPRIAPWRYGAKLDYVEGDWTANLALRHTTRQDRITAAESATPGYTLLEADLSRRFSFGRVSSELFVRGKNLTNTYARDHTSFLKDFAPLAGRGVTVGVRITL